jgi:hypothetical protein
VLVRGGTQPIQLPYLLQRSPPGITLVAPTVKLVPEVYGHAGERPHQSRLPSQALKDYDTWGQHAQLAQEIDTEVCKFFGVIYNRAQK